MKKTRYIIIGLLLLSYVETIKSQNLLFTNNTIYDTIYSEVLKEKRSIAILLPEIQTSDTNQRYDVLYVTDGQYGNKMVTQVSQYLASTWLIPKLIIVNIPHNNLQGLNIRERDLLPPNNSPGSGRADNFLSFLKNELIPYVNKTYPTSGKNIISGGSLGGTFIMYALLMEPQLFDSYIAGDPAFWWDDYYINKLAAEKMHDFPGIKTLFMSGRGAFDGLDYRSMGIYDMDSIIKSKSPKGLHLKSIAYPDETHSSIGLKTMYDGLRFVYDGYDVDVKFHPMNGVLLRNKPIKILPPPGIHYLNLRYTTDGTEPTESSQKFHGFDLIQPTVIKLRLFSASGRYDQRLTGNFIIGNVFPANAKPKNSQAGGLHYTYYKGEWDTLPSFKKLKPDKAGSIGEIYDQYGVFNLPNQPKLACLIEGWMEIKEDGYYTLLIDTDNEAKLYLSEQLIINCDGIDKNMRLQTYILPLEKGFYPLRLEYFQKKGGWGFRFNYQPYGIMYTKPVPLEQLYSPIVTKVK